MGRVLLIGFQLFQVLELGDQDIIVVGGGASLCAEVDLHPLDLGDLVLQGHHAGLGFPQVLRLGLAVGGLFKFEHDDVLDHIAAFLPEFEIRSYTGTILSHLGKDCKTPLPEDRFFSGHRKRPRPRGRGA